jgi:hypothetical protein
MMLLGSSLLPSMINIGDKEVQLGDVVRRAYHDSNLTVTQWNNLDPLEREGLLARAVYTMRAETSKEQR